MTRPQLHRVTRVEVIGPEGRLFVAYCEPGVHLDWQDDDRTLKVFVGPPTADRSPWYRELEADIRQDRAALAALCPVEPRKPSEGTTGADEHDRPLWSAMDK